MSLIGRQASEDAAFWRAIEMACASTEAEDVADVGRYVASRGRHAVDAFEARLDRELARLVTAGVPGILARSTVRDGRQVDLLDNHELEQCLQVFLLGGKRSFEALLAAPEVVAGSSGRPMVDLRRAIRLAQAEPGITDTPLWVEKPGDRRRDGSPWISISLALGIGAGEWNSPPWNHPRFGQRFEKGALTTSVENDWREWRATVRTKYLDIWVEYCQAASEPERVAVTDRGRTTAVTVYRDAQRVCLAEDIVAVADEEVRLVLELVREAVPE